METRHERDPVQVSGSRLTINVRGGTMTRLCVCVSGQVRAIEQPLSRLARLLEGRNATVVFSLWDRIGRKLDGALNLDQLWRLLDADAELAIPSAWIGHQAFWAALPVLRQRLETLNQAPQPEFIRERIAAHFPDALVDIERSDLLDLDFPHPIGEDRHSLRLLYKIWRVNKIKRGLERRGGPFDVVIRMRPDLALDNVDLDRVIREAMQGRVVVGYWGSDRSWCSDGFAAGRSADIDAYSALFARAIAEPFAWQHIHIDLADHLNALGLVVAPYPDAETLLDDQRVSAAELLDSLRATPAAMAGSAAHALTRVALESLAELNDGRVDDALARLLGAGDYAQSASDAERDGFMLVLARTLQAAGLPVLAAAAALRSGALSQALRFRRGQAAMDALLAGVAVSPPSWQGLEMAWDESAWELEVQRAPAAATLVTGQSSAPGARPQRVALSASAAVAVLSRMVAEGQRELARPLVLRTVAAITLTPAMSAATPEDVRKLLALAAETAAPLNAEQREALRVLALQQTDDVQALYELAESLRQTAHFREAAAVQARAVELDPRHAGARRQFAEILLAQGQFQEAREQAEQAVLLHNCPEHRVLLALIEHGVGIAPPPSTADDLAAADPRLRERLKCLAGYAAFASALGQRVAQS